MSATAALLIGGQLAQGLFQSSANRRKERRRRKRRRSFFDNELSPLLEDAQIDTDIDFNSIRQAELSLPFEQMQNQMRDLSQNRDAVINKSGFQNNSFTNNNFRNDQNLINKSFDAQTYNVDKSLVDLQSQLESISNQNKIQAKQIEYEYKYG